MYKKLTAILTALLFPVLYLLIRLMAQAAATAAVLAHVRARSPEIADEWIRNQARLILRGAQPWMLMGTALLTILLIGLLFWRSGSSLAGFVGAEGLKSSLAAAIAALGFGLSFSLNTLFLLLPLPESWMTEHTESVAEPLGAAGAAVKLICTLLIAPLAEEIIFRGLCHRLLLRAFSPVTALLWQAVIFAAFHGTKLQMLYVFPAAVVLGWVYIRCGTLAAPIVLHAAFNAFSALSVPLPGNPAVRVLFLAAGFGITALGLRGVYVRSVKASDPALPANRFPRPRRQ